MDRKTWYVLYQSSSKAGHANQKLFNCTGSKCINAVMLIQLNLVVAKKSMVMGTLRFPENWDLKDINIMESLYHRVVKALSRETLMALFNAYSMIFGEEVAHRVARAHSFASPPQ